MTTNKTCPFCWGTGIDPTFQDSCKCTVQKDEVKPSEGQVSLIEDLVKGIDSFMGVKVDWVKFETKSELANVIDLLMVTKALAKAFNAKESMLTDEQKKAISSQVAGKPTKKWVNDANKKLASIGKPENNTGIAIWRQAKINMLVKELGNKLSDEQQKTIKAKMVTANNEWAEACITKLLKIKSS